MIELNRIRCWRCSHTLARVTLAPGSAVEIKCDKCNAMNSIVKIDRSLDNHRVREYSKLDVM